MAFSSYGKHHLRFLAHVMLKRANRTDLAFELCLGGHHILKLSQEVRLQIDEELAKVRQKYSHTEPGMVLNEGPVRVEIYPNTPQSESGKYVSSAEFMGPFRDRKVT